MLKDAALAGHALDRCAGEEDDAVGGGVGRELELVDDGDLPPCERMVSSKVMPRRPRWGAR